MRRLKIQRVSRVPPIPTMIIVIPNVQLSIIAYLLKIWHPPYTIIKIEFQQKSDFFNKVRLKSNLILISMRYDLLLYLFWNSLA